ncbi:MAG: hypothetical protein B7Y12_06240 [Rhizobiales bacterium 24-66-13]|nr:MAG: hypothetical protein B7Y61_03730 [Rhizobiales bacterium 35-66-30]OYZ81770.1 MAG: hypothetical protein B7Y12_06240 [Rhizobiales bacterium 24-66-13]OZB10079.1 MAG: hypothetical protein B7X67_06425 [Rhizobiales bacterium 39-66-18]
MKAVPSQGAMSDPFTNGLGVEIGCTTGTGLRADGTVLSSNAAAYIDPVERILPLSPDVARLHGSHFCRWGVLKTIPIEANGCFRDDLGVTWATTAQGCFPVDHPFAEASTLEIARHPFPPLPSVLQVAAGPNLRALLDAPIPGIVGTALALTGAWRFLEIFTEDPTLTSALLDWTLSCTCQYYADLLLRLPRQPDLVFIQDVFGTDQAAFFSEAEFRRFVLPRLSALIASLRTCTEAPLCLQVRGAALPLLPLLADLGIEVLGIDHRARGMIATRVRNAVGSRIILHGTADLVALGRCITTNDLRGTALLLCELAEAMPAIAAPAEPMSAEDLACAARGAACLAALDSDELRDLRRLGPVRSTIERASRHARETMPPHLPVAPSSALALAPSSDPALLVGTSA